MVLRASVDDDEGDDNGDDGASLITSRLQSGKRKKGCIGEEVGVESGDNGIGDASGGDSELPLLPVASEGTGRGLR